MKHILDEIKSWSIENKIQLIEGRFSNINYSVFSPSFDSLEQYLLQMKLLSPKCVLFYIITFGLEKEIESVLSAELEDADEYNSEERKLLYKSMFDSLISYQKYNDEITEIILFTPYENILFTYEISVDWLEAFMSDITNKVTQLSISRENKTHISNEIIQEIIQKLISHKNYIKFESRPKMIDQLIGEILEEGNYEIDKDNLSFSGIRSMAQYKFNGELKNTRQVELANEIKELRDAGLNKAKIIAKLDITDRLYEKCMQL